MWNEMRKSTEATKLSADAAVAATAAWIALERFVITSIEKDQIMFEVSFRNIGKTSALDVKAGIELTFTAPSHPQNFANIPKYEPFQCPKPSAHPGILPPDKVWGTRFFTSDFYKFSPE